MFYSAYFKVVSDCGCFGDALKLTPWQSFGKDVVLLIFILILFVNKNLIRPLFRDRAMNILTLFAIALCAFMGYWVLNHLPLKDFRAYSVGTNIKQGMEIPDGAPKSQIEMIFIYKVNGVDKEFTEKTLASIPPGATFVDRIDKVIVEGYIPPIHDFTMEKEGSDYKDELLNEPKLMIFVMYDLTTADKKGMQALKNLGLLAHDKGYKIIAMSASQEVEIAKAKATFDFTFDFYFCDPITLKTIERANPSIIIVKKGPIVQKVHYNDISEVDL